MTAQDVLNVVATVALSLGGGGVVVLALSSWLGKVWATRILESEKNRFTREIETFKADLSRREFDFQTRFSFYYQQRAEALMKLYGALDMASARIADLVNPIQSGDDEAGARRIEDAQVAFNSAAETFYSRKIFFDEPVCEKIEAVFTAMRIAFSSFQVSRGPGLGGASSTELWHKAYTVTRKDVPPLLKELESAFRASLSVPSPSDAQLAHAAERAQRDRSVSS